jgi:hypothetical protein
MAEREIGFGVVGLGMGAGHARDIHELEGGAPCGRVRRG